MADEALPVVKLTSYSDSCCLRNNYCTNHDSFVDKSAEKGRYTQDYSDYSMLKQTYVS